MFCYYQKWHTCHVSSRDPDDKDTRKCTQISSFEVLLCLVLIPYKSSLEFCSLFLLLSYIFRTELTDHDTAPLQFLEVLNSKKSKLRELRDQISKVEVAEKSPQEEDTDKTESFDGESNEEDDAFSSKDVSATKPSQSNRKRTTRK